MARIIQASFVSTSAASASYSHTALAARAASLTLVSLALLVGGCSSISKSTCEEANYYQIGYSDGRQADSRSNFERYHNQCSEYGIATDREAYNQGYQAGLLEYCTIDNALWLGESGSRFRYVCPAQQTAELEAYYNQGLRRYCVPAEGYQLGLNGQQSSVCDGSQYPTFHQAWLQGSQQKQRDDRKQQLVEELQHLDAEIARLDSDRKDFHKRLRELQTRQRLLNMEYQSLLGINWPVPVSRPLPKPDHPEVPKQPAVPKQPTPKQPIKKPKDRSEQQPEPEQPDQELPLKRSPPPMVRPQ
ncbi:DUF2799 domain-containing protein [Oceanobacter mangrovi]|uniref:DUF2799 domain-containing protein n=1 Tax=Oceanobacter mangrovi TaxID=2862510 RepID=UPI001C8E5C97|nr:DUF2799 domain-containing protein [Oceanobacter mangrovi]